MNGWLVTNPSTLKGAKMASKKGRKSSKKGKRRNKKSNPGGTHKKGKRRGKRTNPFGSITSTVKGFQGPAIKGLAIAGGALAVGVLSQNLIPSKYRSGTFAPVVTVGVALGAAYLASRISALRKYSDSIAVGGIAAAILNAVAAPVLEATQFNLLGQLGQLDRRRLILTPSRTVGALDRRVHVGNRLVPAGMPA